MTSSTIGIDTTTGKRVDIYKLSRLLGLYVIGMQRMGKSGLFETLIDQDIRQGIGVCVLDPHGELIDHVIARLPKNREQDVILLDITDMLYFFGLPLLDCADLQNELSIAKTRSQFLHVFEKAFGITEDNPTMYTLLSNIAYTLIANPGYTMIDIRLLLTNKTCRETLLQNVKPQVRDYWHDHYDQLSKEDQRKESFYILNKLNDFENAPLRYIVGQSTSTVNLVQIMDEGKILLVKLSRQLEKATKLIGSIFVALILNASDTRTTNKLFNLYADEFQNFATEDFAILLEQAPKRGVGVTMAHQNRVQLELSEKQADAKLKARTLNVGNLVVFRVPTDAHEVAGQFDTTPLPSPNQTQQRPKLDITSDPVDWFRQRNRKNTRVMELVDKYLTPFFESEIEVEKLRRSNPLVKSSYGDFEKTVNSFLVNAMKGVQLQKQLTLLDRLMEEWVRGKALSKRGSDDDFPIFYYQSAYISGRRSFLKSYLGNGQFPVVEREQFYKLLCALLFQQWYVKPPMTDREIYKDGYEEAVKQLESSPKYASAVARWNAYYASVEAWQNIKPIGSYYIHGVLQPIYARHATEEPSKPEDPQDIMGQLSDELGQIRKSFVKSQVEVDKEMARLEQESKRQTQERAEKEAQKQLNNFILWVSQWEELATLLAADPIKLPTGEYEDVPVPRTFADMQNEIANTLVKLPKFIARVKLTDENDTVVEYVITTMKPGTGLFRKALQDRIDRIQTNNRTQAKPRTLPYCRPRQDIEAEITKRQNQCSQSQQQPPPPPPQSRRRKLKKCQACGTENTETATVCSQCGKPL